MEYNNRPNPDLILQDEYFCDKNIDRTKFLVQSNILICLSEPYSFLMNKKKNF